MEMDEAKANANEKKHARFRGSGHCARDPLVHTYADDADACGVHHGRPFLAGESTQDALQQLREPSKLRSMLALKCLPSEGRTATPVS